MKLNEVNDILDDIRFLDWEILTGYTDLAMYLQVSFPCPETGAPQKGRKWFLSSHMTRSEVVQTAFKAVLTAMEHEVREFFLYRDRPIFGPHFDVDALYEIADGGFLDVRKGIV